MNQPRLLKENIFENLVPENPPLIGSLGPKVNPFQRKISPKKVSLKALKKKRFKNWSFLIGLDRTRLSATWLEKKGNNKSQDLGLVSEIMQKTWPRGLTSN